MSHTYKQILLTQTILFANKVISDHWELMVYENKNREDVIYVCFNYVVYNYTYNFKTLN